MSVRISYDSKYPEAYTCSMPNCTYSCNFNGDYGGFGRFNGRRYCKSCMKMIKGIKRLIQIWSGD